MTNPNRRDVFAAIGGALLLNGCTATPPPSSTMPNDLHDVHSFGNPDKVRVRTLALDLTASFGKKVLTGTATLGIDAATGTDPLVLDTRDLDVEAIESSADGSVYAPTKWAFGQRDAILGTPLTVTLPAGTRFVRVKYQSRPTAVGLQWLEPPQTAGKRSPFVFSQNQSIQGRSWIPIQDTPGIRISYTARIQISDRKDVVALMAAEHKGNTGGVYEFAMDTPIPPYLIALAIGDLKFQSTGPRTGVYAEPSVVEKAAAEFSDMEKMVEAVEHLYGPYRWGRYDLLILPPSFPIGGMENPRLTFATPTIIAGDKSLAGLVSHELAHSWSGNLVTNATWADFWLNEGFTTYIENRIQEAVFGRDQAVMEQALDYRAIKKEMADLPPKDQILHVDLNGRDPEEGFTGVPYTKGALLLRLMEQTFGRNTFDTYLRGYFDHFAFQSITTATMLDYMKRELLDKHPAEAAKINLDEWIEKPGLPASAPQATSERLTKVADLAKAFTEGKVPALAISTKRWSTQEWLEFLQNMPMLDAKKMGELDDVFLLTKTGNAEILDEWLQLAIRANYTPAYPRVASFLQEVGRQKFIKPLYTELMKTPDGQKRAREIYAKARPGYHPLSQNVIDKIMAGTK
ncbi:MAG: M1 family metallopeptidase [Acidobacteriota bacterium]